MFSIVSVNAILFVAQTPQGPSDDMNASSRIDINVYHKAPSKKKNKKRNLVASARCTLQELARLQAQQQCKQRSQFWLSFKSSYLMPKQGVEIELNCVSQRKVAANKAKPTTIILVAKLDLPGVREAQPMYLPENVGSEIASEDPEDEGKITSIINSGVSMINYITSPQSTLVHRPPTPLRAQVLSGLNRITQS